MARTGCLVLGLLTVTGSTILLVWMAPDWPTAAGDDLLLLLGLVAVDLIGLAALLLAFLPDHRLDQWGAGSKPAASSHPGQSPHPRGAQQN